MKLRDLVPELFPEDQREQALELIEDYDECDAEELFEKYPELFADYEDAEDFEAEAEDGTVGLGTLLVWNMVERGLLLQLDWSGEEDDNEVADYVNYRLELLDDDGLEVSADELYERFREDAASASPQLQRGDHLPALFQYLNRQLRPHGYRLLCFDANCDQYYIGVFPQERARWLLTANPTDVGIFDVDEIE